MMNSNVILDIANKNNHTADSFFKSTSSTYNDLLSFLNSHDSTVRNEIFFNLSCLLNKSLDQANNYLFLIALGSEKIKREGK